MKPYFKALTKTIGKDEAQWKFGLPTYDFGSDKITGITDGKAYFPILPETLCQTTGRLDKNGKDVFEKDRLKFVHNVGKQKIEEVLTVYYNESAGQYVVGKSDCLLPLAMYKTEEGEVIGNENDDLFIKPKKERKK